MTKLSNYVTWATIGLSDTKTFTVSQGHEIEPNMHKNIKNYWTILWCLNNLSQKLSKYKYFIHRFYEGSTDEWEFSSYEVAIAAVGVISWKKTNQTNHTRRKYLLPLQCIFRSCTDMIKYQTNPRVDIIKVYTFFFNSSEAQNYVIFESWPTRPAKMYIFPNIKMDTPQVTWAYQIPKFVNRRARSNDRCSLERRLLSIRNNRP